jgi:cytochrome c553
MKGLIVLSIVLGLKAFAADAVKGKELYGKCIACHGADGMGKKSQAAPMLAGQYDWYIEAQIKAIATKERNTPNAAKMYPFVKNLTDDQMKDLAAYVQSLAKK